MLFRITFKMLSSITGNIDSNTFFGLFCQAYKIKNSEDDLKILLEMLKDNLEQLVFTNPLETGTFEFMNKRLFNQMPRVTIDRSGCGNNTLESYKAEFINSFDTLLYTTLSKKEIEDTFETMKILGIGAKKSIGNGVIKDIKVKELNESELVKSKTVKCMSNIIPSDDTNIYGNFEFITRTGKTIDGQEQNPVIMIKAGSELLSNDKLITGCIVYDEKTCTYINGKGITI